jgi:hypothetical protein
MQAGGAVGGVADLEALGLEAAAQRRADARVVVDDQDMR